MNRYASIPLVFVGVTLATLGAFLLPREVLALATLFASTAVGFRYLVKKE